MGDPTRVTTLRVYCSGPAPAGSLLFVPLVSSALSISLDTMHPHRVRCGTMEDGRDMYIAPCVRGRAKNAALAAPKAGPMSEWIVPFWVIRRSQDKKECNCVLAEIQIDSITTIGAGGPMLKVEAPRVVADGHLTLPVITNVMPLTADSELVIHVATKTKSKAGPPPPKRLRTGHTAKAPAALAAGDTQCSPEAQVTAALAATGHPPKAPPKLTVKAAVPKV